MELGDVTQALEHRGWGVGGVGQRLVAFGDSISSFLCFFPFSFPPSLRAPASSQTEVIVSISFTSRLVLAPGLSRAAPEAGQILTITIQFF